MDFIITKRLIENHQILFEIEISSRRVNLELKKAAGRLAHEMPVPGFRKGKAPYQIVVQHFGLSTLYDEFLELLGQEAYDEAILQADFRPYAAELLDKTEIEPLRYRVLFSLEPVVELGDYRSLRIKKEIAEVSNNVIAEKLREYQERYADWKTVNRPSQFNDKLRCDVYASYLDDPNLIVLDEHDWELTLEHENPIEPAGLNEALLGMRPGESKTVVLSYPINSFSVHAGKTLKFVLKLNELLAYQTPELTDDFARLVNPDCNKLSELVDNIRTSFVEIEESRINAEYPEKVLGILRQQSKLNYPPIVIEDQIDALIDEHETRLQSMRLNLEGYLLSLGKTLDGYREEQRSGAIQIAENNLLIFELAHAEKLQPTEEDFEQKVRELLSKTDESSKIAQDLVEKINTGPGRTILEVQILREKVLERLLTIVSNPVMPPKGKKTKRRNGAT